MMQSSLYASTCDQEQYWARALGLLSFYIYTASDQHRDFVSRSCVMFPLSGLTIVRMYFKDACVVIEGWSNPSLYPHNYVHELPGSGFTPHIDSHTHFTHFLLVHFVEVRWLAVLLPDRAAKQKVSNLKGGGGNSGLL